MVNVQSFIEKYVDQYYYKGGLDKWIDSIKYEEERFRKILSYRYAIEQSLPEKSILFLGLNPSYNETISPGFYPDYNNTHFKRGLDTISSLNKDLNRNDLVFAQHDLLFVRETDHNVVMKMMQANKAFYQQQIDLTLAVLHEAKPMLIVAENAELFNIILRGNGKEFHYTQTWNEELGVDFFQFKGWEKPVPILFTGMLSVLNNGSYYSLRWHIRHILRSLCR